MASKRVFIFDTTLRDGEQSPGCSMNIEEKLVMARQLERLGVDVIEAGFPAASQGDFDAVRAVAQEIGGSAVCGLARTNPADVERALDALKPAARGRLHTFIATSEIHMRDKLRMSPEQVLEQVEAAVKLAAASGMEVEFSAEDATRSDWGFLVDVCTLALELGAGVLNIPDTVGYTTPFEYAELIGHLREKVPGSERAVFSVHCHDDLGLSVANSLAAVRAGAAQIECTVNGIGERAGNTALEEVVMALKVRGEFFEGADTGVNTEELYSSSRTLSQIIGVPVQPNKAIVGENAFAHEAGIHQHGVLANKLTYEIMTPQSVGRASNELVLGKHSGRHAFADRLRELGYDPEQADLDNAFKRFKALADAKKKIYNEDIEALITDQLLRLDTTYRMERLSVVAGTFATPTATVEISVDGEERKAAAMGTGPVDAIFTAIEELTGTGAQLLRFQVNAVTSGIDAQGEVSVTLEEEGLRVIGQGADTDILVASANAYVNALNKLEQRKRAGVSSLRGI